MVFDSTSFSHDQSENMGKITHVPIIDIVEDKLKKSLRNLFIISYMHHTIFLLFTFFIIEQYYFKIFTLFIM